MARRLGAAPSPRSFGDSAAQAGARRVVICGFKKMVRSAGLAPASPDWQPGILLLDDDRMGGASRSARAAYDKKRTNTAAFLVKDTHWISRWIFRCFRHTSRKAFGL